MSRNKNTKGTGDRGAIPESLVGKLMKQGRELEEVKKELADLKKAGTSSTSATNQPEPAAPPPPPPPPPPPAPPAPEPEPKPKPEPKPEPKRSSLGFKQR